MGLHPDLYIKNNKNNSLFGLDIKNVDLENLKSKNLIISDNGNQKHNNFFILVDGSENDQFVISDNILCFGLSVFEGYSYLEEIKDNSLKYDKGNKKNYNLNTFLENYNGNKYNLIRKDGIVFNVWDHGILEECKLKESGFSISKKDIDNPDVYLFLSEKIICFYHFFGHKEIDLSEKNIYTQLNELPINKHIV